MLENCIVIAQNNLHFRSFQTSRTKIRQFITIRDGEPKGSPIGSASLKFCTFWRKGLDACLCPPILTFETAYSDPSQSTEILTSLSFYEIGCCKLVLSGSKNGEEGSGNCLKIHP